jgi:hypothetical protein
MTVLDASKWGKLNVWRHPGGGLAVRPGMRRIYTPSAGSSIVAAFSVRTDFPGGGDVAHYVVTRHATGVHVLVLDENLDTFQDFTWSGTDIDPRAVTCAVVDQQIMINSPDLPPLYTMVGIGGLVFARSVDSDTGDTVIEPPSGITIAVQNRVATASGRLVFFSDPVAIEGGDIRSFVGFNVNQRPGVIFGLHEIEAGLVAVTTAGTFLLEADAFAVGQVGMNGTAWRQLSSVSAHSFNSTCVHNGRVYALTETGWIACDSPSTAERELSDETMPRARGPAICLPDYRACRMLSAQAGPVIAAPDIGAIHLVDLAHDVSAWWRDWTDEPGDLRGILTDHYGGELWAMATGIYRLCGDFDGEIPLADAEDIDQPVGTLFATVPTAADANALPREVNIAAAVDGPLRMFIAVRGNEHEGDAVDADPMGIIFGEDDWSEAAPKRWTSTPMANMRAKVGDVEDTTATRDVSLEVSASGALVRLSVMPTITMSKSAPTRPQSEG